MTKLFENKIKTIDMVIINVTEGFAPFPATHDVKVFTFPSGIEHHVKLPEQSFGDGDVLVTIRIESDADIMKLLLLKDALQRRDDVKNVSLFLPFLPYARQDRVMVQGEPFSSKVMANLINMCNFKKVYVFDAHSDVSLAIIDRCVGISNAQFVKTVLQNKVDYLIVSPDAGAYKKIDKVCEHIGYTNEIVSCSKVRDLSNGKIKRINVGASDLEGKDVYIIDDICDGGGTFNLLATYLQKYNAGRIYLIVSHGIFSQGEDELKKNLDGVYTTNSVKDIHSSFIKQLALCEENLSITF